jgi:hypothetical protein
MSQDLLPADDATEIDVLASEMAHAYHRMATFYRDQMQLTGAEADTRARGVYDSPEEAAADTARIQKSPPDEVSWFDFTRLAERDPAEMAALWQRLKVDARNEFESGHRTADALEWQGKPWDRARFLAIRVSFRGETPPRNGIEAALIDSAAEAFSDYLEWTQHLHMMAGVDMEAEHTRAVRDGEWRPQRLSYAQSIDRAARMVEQAHARFLRTVKMLHEVRKFAPSVYVGHAGQINVGHQQMNVSTSPADEQNH